MSDSTLPTGPIPPSEDTLPAGASLTRRERLILLCNYNAEVLQAHMEEAIGSLPLAASTGILWYLKRTTEGVITRDTLWKIPGWLLYSRFDNAGFDRLYELVMQWLRDL